MHTGDIRGIAAAARILMMHWAKTWFQLPRENADGETTGQVTMYFPCFHMCFSRKCEVKRNEWHRQWYWWNSIECWWKRNNVLLFFYTINHLECVFIFSKVMLMFKSIHACAGLKMDRHLTCTHSLLMGMRAATQSHRQPVKLFEGRTNVIPQLYQSHRWALGFITDQEGKTGKQKGDCGRGQLI